MAKTLLGMFVVGMFVMSMAALAQSGASPAPNPRPPVIPAHGVVSQTVMSLTMAKSVAEAALDECRAKGYHTSVVVVDGAGQVMVMLRDEQASAQTLEMARRKAYTARMFRSTTLEFQKRTAADPSIAAQRDVFDILALGGGAPITIDRETIGAVGSSGSSIEQDDACAKAGVAKAMELMKVKLF